MSESRPSSVAFTAGARSACVKGELVLLLDLPLSDERVMRAWEAIDSGESADIVVGVLLSEGMNRAPDFALVAVIAAGETRIVVRGALTVTGVDRQGEFRTSAHGILTDEVRFGLERARLHGPEPVVMSSVPLVAGVVPAVSVDVLPGSAAPGAALTETTSSSSKPPPEPSPDNLIGVADESCGAGQAALPEATPALPPKGEPPQVSAGPSDVGAVQTLVGAPAPEVLAESVPGAAPEPPASGPSTVPTGPSRYERLFGARPNEAAPTPAEVELDGLPESQPITGDPDAGREADATDKAPRLMTEPSPVVVVGHDAPHVAPYLEAQQLPSADTGVIEGIPDFIMVARTPGAAPGPEARAPAVAPPEPGRSLDSATPSHGTRQASAPGRLSAPYPSAQRSTDTSSLTSGAPSSLAPVVGHTINRAALPRRAAEVVTVWATWCPSGHPSQAVAAHCRVCDLPMPADAVPQEIPRPSLGRLVLPAGPPVEIDGELILGRDPHGPIAGGSANPRLVVLNDPRREVSSLHASITLNYWDVCLTDLGSTNGTEVVTPDGRRQRLVADTTLTILPGTRIILAEIFDMLFEAMP